jgi:hypothetical protein
VRLRFGLHLLPFRIGFKDYLPSRRVWFFGLQIVYILVDLFDSWFKGADYFASLGLEYPIAQAASIVLFIVAMATRNERVHGAIAVIFLAYQTTWMLRVYETVRTFDAKVAPGRYQ